MRQFRGKLRRLVVTKTQSETRTTQFETKATQSGTKTTQFETKTAQPEGTMRHSDVIGGHSDFEMPTEETIVTHFIIATTQPSNRRRTS